MIKYLLVLLLFCLNSFGCIKTAPFNSTLNLNDIKWKIIKEELESDFDNINLIRPVESDNLKKVEDFIVDSLDSVGWDTIRDKFTQNTVNGEKSFTNIIATLPSSEGTLDDDYFVLACHYESKMMENFYGSIDSAMPCAIILQIAKYISKLDHRKAKLKLFFFDGEEAFKEWTAEDSLYGSRYLADKLAKESFGDGNPPRNELSRIKLFILLDLIGGKKCEIPDYIIYQTNSYYSLLVDIETTATKLGLLTSEFSQSEKRHFGQTTRSMVSDDHIPFYNRGVPILHLIPTPFPFQWHTVQDNKSNIDFDESFDLLLIFAAFIQTIITE